MKKYLLAIVLIYMASMAWGDGIPLYSGDTLETGSSTTLPGSCETGELYVDTDADTDGSLYICISGTWKEVDDDGGAGSGSMHTVKDDGVQVGDSDIETLDFGTGMTATETPDKEMNITLDADLLTLAGPTAWRLFYSNGSSVITELALGASGTYLKSNGASAAPSFATPGAGSAVYYSAPKYTYKDADEVYIDGAGYYLAGIGTVYWTSQLTFQFGSAGSNSGSDDLDASNWHYFYLDYSTIGTAGAIVASDFINDTTEPIKSHTKNGYYNGDDKCVFAVLTDGSSNILEFFHYGDVVYFADYIVSQTAIDIDNTYTDVAALDIPSFSTHAIVSALLSVANKNWYWRTDGQAGSTGHGPFWGWNAISSNSGPLEVITSAAQVIEVKLNASDTTTIAVHTEGWHLPPSMLGNVGGS